MKVFVCNENVKNFVASWKMENKKYKMRKDRKKEENKEAIKIGSKSLRVCFFLSL